MPEFTQLEASTPITQPLVEEKIYDKYWMSGLSINASDSTKPVRLVAKFIPARDVTVEIPQKDENGNVITDENGQPVTTSVTYKETLRNIKFEKTLIIQDIFAEAVKDPTGFGLAIETVLATIKAKAIEKKIL